MYTSESIRVGLYPHACGNWADIRVKDCEVAKRVTVWFTYQQEGHTAYISKGILET